MDKKILRALSQKNSEAGFALIAAIMACLILLALGMLVISLSTQDIRVSTKIVGGKRALAAAEEGISSLSRDFDPALPITFSTTHTPIPRTVADALSLSRSSYTVNYPATRPTVGPITMRIAGYSITGEAMGLSRYNVDVVGANDEYQTQVTIGVGIGWGPVPMTTTYR